MTFAKEIMLPVHLELSEAGPSDYPFMERVYLETHTALMRLNLPSVTIGMLSRQQYLLQQASFAKGFAGYWKGIVLHHDVRVGSIQVFQDKQKKLLRLLDLGLLACARGQGTGTSLLRALLLWANDRDWRVRLTVQRNNLRALKLYQKLGFVERDANELDFSLEWLGSQSFPSIPKASC